MVTLQDSYTDSKVTATLQVTCRFSVVDTIPGRQCMASCFFLLKQFEDVLIYLNSIKVSFTERNSMHNIFIYPWLINIYCFPFNHRVTSTMTIRLISTTLKPRRLWEISRKQRRLVRTPFFSRHEAINIYVDSEWWWFGAVLSRSIKRRHLDINFNQNPVYHYPSRLYQFVVTSQRRGPAFQQVATHFNLPPLPLAWFLMLYLPSPFISALLSSSSSPSQLIGRERIRFIFTSHCPLQYLLWPYSNYSPSCIFF